MSTSKQNDIFVFIVGSPRSGTTVLGEILDKHRRISQWYEPYFVWDRYFRNTCDDERTAEDATPTVKKQVYSDFLRYKRRTGAEVIVDKSPRNSLKIPFIRKIFPAPRFIHILRDGRDVTLSIHKEWVRRGKIIKGSQNEGFHYTNAVDVMRRWLKRQSFAGDKIKALWFETHGHLVDKSKHLNRLRWNGDIGWGPRFKDWEVSFRQQSGLQFNAMQWRECVKRIYQHWPEIPAAHKLELRYEELISNEKKVVSVILNFLGLDIEQQFWKTIPELKKDNTAKWRNEFSQEQLNEIQEILTPMLIQLGYEDKQNWHLEAT